MKRIALAALAALAVTAALTGSATAGNDWNYNDGCAVSTTKDGGST
jgi:hypothetical protein